jgi:hypothetical protein
MQEALNELLKVMQTMPPEQVKQFIVMVFDWLWEEDKMDIMSQLSNTGEDAMMQTEQPLPQQPLPEQMSAQPADLSNLF